MLEQELTAYLDTHFREISRQIADAREESTRQIAASREESTRQIAGLREEFGHRFENLERRLENLDGRLESLERRFEGLDRRVESLERRTGQLEETGRQTLVLVESLRDEVHLVAEGYVGVIERLERYQSTAALTYEQVRGWIEPYFRDVDRRVEILEGRSDRLQGNVMDAIRRLVGRPPLHEPPVSSE